MDARIYFDKLWAHWQISKGVMTMTWFLLPFFSIMFHKRLELTTTAQEHLQFIGFT